MRSITVIGLLSAALLSACVDEKDASDDTGERDPTTAIGDDTAIDDTATGAADDTSVTDDTSADDTAVETGLIDTGDTGGPPPLECDVPNPRSFEEELDLLYGITMLGLEELDFHTGLIDFVFDGAAGPGVPCPAVTELLGTYVADAGEGCTNRDGVYYEGAISVVVDDASGAFSISYEDFLLQIDDDKGSADYRVSGTFGIADPDGAEATVTLALVEERYLYGEYNEAGFINGSFDRELSWLSQSTGEVQSALSGGGVVKILESEDGWTGDYCAELDLTFVDACEEPDGPLVFVGEQHVVMAFDGASDCDDCGELTVDGESVGEICL